MQSSHTPYRVGQRIRMRRTGQFKDGRVHAIYRRPRGWDVVIGILGPAGETGSVLTVWITDESGRAPCIAATFTAHGGPR